MENSMAENVKSANKLNIFGRIVYSNISQNFIILCIILNSIQLGLDTSESWREFAGSYSKIIDTVFVWIFALEIVLKLLSDKHRFFVSGWNIFDFIVVAISFVPGNGAFSVLRVFRIFRTFRLLYKIPRLRIITESLIRSIPSIGWICVLLSINFYICSVIATNIFGKEFPAWFGGVHKSMYSLFQIMTLESWSMGIVRPVMEKFPYAWLLFVPFIVFTTYTVMNLFIGIMVTSISECQGEKESEELTLDEKILAAIENLQGEIKEIKAENNELKAALLKAVEQNRK